MEVDEAWIASILKENDSSDPDGISDVLKIETSSGVGKNENSGSDIIRLTVAVQLCSGETTTKTYIYKKERSSRMQEYFNLMDFFELETSMYIKYLKMMKELYLENGGADEYMWPKCYGHKPNVILLQDLKACGFKTIEKRSGGMDWNHSSLLIKQLAKFHSLSAALIENGKIDPSDFAPSIFLQNDGLANKFHRSGLLTLVDVIKSDWGPEWEDLAKRIENVADVLGEKFESLGKKTKDKLFKVLNHGDCWTNNVMYKYDDSGDPAEMVFIDFQTCHVNNFAWDLTYFLYNCLLPDYRREVIGQLLDLYTSELDKNCKRIGYKGEVPSRMDVQDAMDEVMIFGLVNSLCTIPLLLSVDKPDFVFELEKLIPEDTDQPDSDCNPFDKSCYTDQSCIEIMKKELKYYASVNIL